LLSYRDVLVLVHSRLKRLMPRLENGSPAYQKACVQLSCSLVERRRCHGWIDFGSGAEQQPGAQASGKS
jgi:hypothetical protein